MRADAWLLELNETAEAPSLAPPFLDQGVLDERERRRAAAFRRPADRVLYVAAHVALRTVLAGLLGERPADLEFTREPCPCCDAPHGRPALALPGPPLHFSLSHTRGRVLIATAPVPVGADVERRPEPAAVRELVAVLHPAERAEVGPDGDAAAFGRIWARKEAYLKGLGTGLGRAAHLDDLSTAATAPAGWSLYDLPCGPSHDAALALRASAALAEPPSVHRLSATAELIVP
ncbi:4'-phosphopantetheinyl transferase superfamily protein [Streptomyces sp. SKN60]|uniref:4'-phosphopantetheinyl transferase family protein n=1 Tax=Streptomyces sp. SKN60 TaxID=2855506 RepID=UPI002245FD98|nr:4'-phosphopantetheinyl transferase superfamily protein [Streptomyces sp. SKN60]MCX2185260.1 4'-phosphopantetheinyl transferase superfamily protein [Streptomyces sp. SKN60]